MLSYIAKGLGRCDKVKYLESGRLSWIVWMAQCHHKGPYKRKEGGSRVRTRGAVTTEVEVKERRKICECRQPLETGKGEELCLH